MNDSIVTYPSTQPVPDVDGVRGGYAVLVWVLALTALATSPAVVIAGWRWFL